MVSQSAHMRNRRSARDTPETMSATITSLESLNGLLAFASAVEAGGFSAAGRRLGLSASAVGKAVDRLEVRLGMRLLNRSTRALALTGEGEVLYRHVTRILQDLQEAERDMRLQETTPRGRLKVSVPIVLGRKHVLPALLDFHALYPEIMIDISLESWHLDLIQESYDVALWAGELEDSGLQARRLGPLGLITCAAPRYLQANGVPQTPADLADHCCIKYRHPHSGRLEPWAFSNETAATKPRSMITLNEAEAVVVTAVVGWGIVQAPEYMLREELQAGHLLPVLPGYTRDDGSISLVWPARSAQVPRVRAFIDFIAGRLITALYPPVR